MEAAGGVEAGLGHEGRPQCPPPGVTVAPPVAMRAQQLPGGAEFMVFDWQ